MRDRLGEELLSEMLHLHARILRRMPVFQVLLIAAIGWIVLPDTPWRLFLAWAACAFAVECARAAAAWWALARLGMNTPHPVHGIFLSLDAIAGLAIGVCGALFLPRIPLLSQMVLEITLFTVAAAGASVVVSSKYMLAAYSSMVLIGAAASWSHLHRHQAPVVIALTVLYWLFLIGVSRDGERLLLRSITIRRERDEALHALERSNSEVQAAAMRAEQAAQSRARVLAAASHDLRQPLHALSVYSAVLLANPGPRTLEETGRNIDKLVRTLGEILGELFDLSRLSTGAYRLQREPFALDETIAGVCAEYAAAAAERGLALIHELAPVQMLGDAGAVGRIARNLIDNAIKYTDHGEVRVLTTQSGPMALLEVRDTGRGVARVDQERIFEEFYQIDNSGRDRDNGVGLGLSIVKHLCELLRARIDLESTPGQGTCFKISLPGALAETIPASAALAVGLGAPSWRGLTVLVVDDDDTVRSSMRTLLTMWGFEVRSTSGAAEADQLLAHWGRPDLMIADLRLRDAEDGASLAARLSALHGPFPTLIITGESAEHALRAVRDRDYTVLQKPVPVDALYAAVGAALRDKAIQMT